MMLDFIKNVSIGLVFLAIIALIIYFVPYIEWIIVVVAGISISYAIGLLFRETREYNKAREKIQSDKILLNE